MRDFAVESKNLSIIIVGSLNIAIAHFSDLKNVPNFGPEFVIICFIEKRERFFFFCMNFDIERVESVKIHKWINFCKRILQIEYFFLSHF